MVPGNEVDFFKLVCPSGNNLVVFKFSIAQKEDIAGQDKDVANRLNGMLLQLDPICREFQMEV